MKKLNLNEKGFTLIELLAVIVILAIVMVLASQSVLPFMRNASKDSFAIEANGAIDAASNAISLFNVGQLTLDDDPGNGLRKYGTGSYCMELKFLVKEGLYSLRSDKVGGDSPDYSGYVLVLKSKDSNTYKYRLKFRNKKYVYNLKETENETKSIDKDSKYISEYASEGAFTCPESQSLT